MRLRDGVHSFRHALHLRAFLRTLHDLLHPHDGQRCLDILVEKYLLSPTMPRLWLNQNRIHHFWWKIIYFTLSFAVRLTIFSRDAYLLASRLWRYAFRQKAHILRQP
jgi:hypothetical protein